MLNTAIRGTLDQHRMTLPVLLQEPHTLTLHFVFVARCSDVTRGISRNLSLENLPWKDVIILVYEYKYIYIYILLEKGYFQAAMSDFSPDESLIIVFGGNANLRLDSKSFLWVGFRLLYYFSRSRNQRRCGNPNNTSEKFMQPTLAW